MCELTWFNKYKFCSEATDGKISWINDKTCTALGGSEAAREEMEAKIYNLTVEEII